MSAGRAEQAPVASGKPPRTLGLSLAIVAAVLLFTVLPLLHAGLLLAFRLRIARVTVPGSDVPFAVGGNFDGLTDSALGLQVALGVTFMIIAIFAWVGRPRAIRWVMMAAVLGLTLVSAGIALGSVLVPQTVNSGLDSAAAVGRGAALVRLGVSVLLALYVLWYMNRGPARAFYRGHYLPAPE